MGYLNGIAAAAGIALLAASGTAQAAEAQLKQLEIHDGSRGYAVVLDGDGHEHYCEARVTREAVDLGPCKPLRLVTPLVAEKAMPEPAALPSVSPAKAQVISLFERNGCALSYQDLKSTIEPLGARQRQVIGELIASMTERGEIVDDATRERAVLRTGDRCG